MKAILGVKKDMTQLFNEEGKVQAATIIDVSDCIIADIYTEKDRGYNAVKIGLQKDGRANKPSAGVSKKLPFTPKYIREVRNISIGEDEKVGQTINPDIFEMGEKVTVTGISKGKGFAGVVKRWHFHGGPKTHGQSNKQRHPGSIGGGRGGTAAGRVIKGLHMGGRMGNDRVSMKNLKVLQVDNENMLLTVSGNVPGSRGGLVIIKAS